MGIEGMRSMRGERMEKGLGHSTLGAVVDELTSETLDAGPDALAERPRVYSLERSISPKELEATAMLDIECILTDTDGDLILETGDLMTVRSRRYDSTDGSAVAALEADEITDTRSHRSRFTMHNHPVLPFVTTGGHWVSHGDFESSRQKSSEIDFIVARDGVIGHTARQGVRYLPWLQAGVEPGDHPHRFNAALLKMITQGNDRTLREQKEAGVIDFFVPFRGDEESQRKLELICGFINDPDAKWEDIRAEVEAE